MAVRLLLLLPVLLAVGLGAGHVRHLLLHALLGTLGRASHRRLLGLG